MVRPRQYVEAPPVTPLPYGLLSAALVLDDLTGHAQMGVEYEPEACATAHTTRAACEAAEEFGTLSVSVDAAGVATITASGFPTRGTSYTVVWGDGETWSGGAPDGWTGGAPEGVTHTYADAGVYPVRVTDDRYGYLAEVSVTVADGAPSGPFDATVSQTKVPTEGIDLVTADPFTLYTLFRCAPVGVDLEDRARRTLRIGEQRGVEEAVANRLPLSEGAVDLTPVSGSPTHPLEGLALLEGFAAQFYGGVPVIHMPRKVGTIMPGIDRQGARLETRQGSLVASGGGYHHLAGPPTDAGDPTTIQEAPTGSAWIYVTGQVVVRRDPQVQAIPMTMGRAPAVNLATVLAERSYAASWECVTAAVLVSTRFINGVLSGVSYPDPA